MNFCQLLSSLAASTMTRYVAHTTEYYYYATAAAIGTGTITSITASTVEPA